MAGMSSQMGQAQMRPQMMQQQQQQQQPAAPIHFATKADTDSIKAIVKDIGFGMLTTQDANGDLRSRPMGVNGEVECKTNESGGMMSQPLLTFFTYKDSSKCHEMLAHGNKVNLSFCDVKKNKFMSLSGTGTVSQDRDEMSKRWDPSLKEWFPNGMDTVGICLLKVLISKAEYWSSPSLLSQAVSFVTGQSMGEGVSQGHKADFPLKMHMGSGMMEDAKEMAMKAEAKI